MAYPISGTSSMLSKLQYVCRHNSKIIFTAVACLIVLLFILDEELPENGKHYLRPGGSKIKTSSASSNSFLWGGAIRPGYFYPAEAIHGEEFLFAAVTDLDELSKDLQAPKPQFYSILLGGSLQKRNDDKNGGSRTRYEILLNVDATRKLVTKHNEAGRGAEFSELTIYQNRLLTFDDRTGEVFEILNTDNGQDSFVVPRFVVTEGNGETDKGMKWEWSTVKDGEMYIGSMGKEYTNRDGQVMNRNNLWVAVINEYGQIRREDWSSQYNFVRHALNCDFPGYIILEACRWSPILKKWVVLPRRISQEAYDEVKDEQMGGHQLVLVDEAFTTAQVVDIKLESLDPLKGFSTFAFVPNSGDQHVLAIRSVEDNCVDFTPECKQRSFFVVFDIFTGEPLSNEVQYKDLVKFEGVEFVDLNAVPPPPSSQ
jgi:soluble calcium-activated nucleotidase 1